MCWFPSLRLVRCPRRSEAVKAALASLDEEAFTARPSKSSGSNASSSTAAGAAGELSEEAEAAARLNRLWRKLGPEAKAAAAASVVRGARGLDLRLSLIDRLPGRTRAYLQAAGCRRSLPRI